MMRDSSPPEAMRASGTQLLAGVGRQQELGPLEAALRPLRRVDRGLRVRRGERHLEPRLLHGQLRELGLHALAQLERRGPAPLREGARALQVGRPQPLAPRLEGPLLLLRRGQERPARGGSARRTRGPPRPSRRTSSSGARRRPGGSRSRRGGPGSPRAAPGSRAAAGPGPRAARAPPPARRGSGGTRGRSRRGPRPGGRPGRGGRAPRPRRRRAGRTPRRSAPRGGPRWPAAPSRRAGPPPRPPRGPPARSRSPGTPASRAGARPRAGPRAAARGRPRPPAGRGRTRPAAGRRRRPAKWSSRSRCVEGSSSPCGSCCPWMTVSRGARSRRRLTGTRAPFTVARPFPLDWSSRRMTTSSPSALSPRSSRRAAASSTSKTASTAARSSPDRMRSGEARSPSSSPSASIRIDLPAPVSPVRRVRPGPNSTSSAGMRAMLLIRSSLSMPGATPCRISQRSERL